MFRNVYMLAVLFASPTVWAADATDYCVISLVEPNGPWDAAAKKLVDLRRAQHLHETAAKLEDVLGKLQQSRPAYVAFVVRPDQLDLDLVQRVLRLSTLVDSDRFVDFTYGFIAGRPPSAAQQLAARGSELPPHEHEPEFSIAGVAGADYLKKSRTNTQLLPLDRLALATQWHVAVKAQRRSTGRPRRSARYRADDHALTV